MVDLFCGLGGWAEGGLAEGYRVVGFDIERHDYGRGGYPGQLVLQDAHTIHGSQCRDAACIVASPPCQEYSYMAMPWKLAKAKAAAIRADQSGEAMRKLTALFDACFRIQREACEAAGRYIPLIVENVKGAQPWVGPAKARWGSFYLWGDVAMVGNRVVSSVPVFGRWTRPMKSGQKVPLYSDPRRNGGKGVHLTSPRENADGVKCGGDWFNDTQPSISRLYGSKSPARKAASAEIAKIPFELASYIARAYHPKETP